MSDPEPIVRETALWTLAQLETEGLRKTLSTYVDDQAENVRDVARHLLSRTTP